MFKPMFAALIAATALATPALAQDRHGGWHGRDSNQGQSSSGDRGNRGSWRQSQQSAQPQAQAQPEAQPQQYRRQWNGGGQQQQQVQQQQPQQQYRRQWNGGQQQQVQQQQPQQFRRQWNGYGGQQAQGRGQWNGGGQQAQGRGRGEWNGGQQAQGYRGNNSGYRSNGNRGNRGNWSNGWRGDNRYDWRGYRSSNRNAFHLPRYYPPRGYGYGYQRYGIGYRLGALLFSSQYWIDDPWSYRLPDAYGPYRWVRYFNDALLVDIETGEVVDVEYDVFW